MFTFCANQKRALLSNDNDQNTVYRTDRLPLCTPSTMQMRQPVARVHLRRLIFVLHCYAYAVCSLSLRSAVCLVISAERSQEFGRSRDDVTRTCEVT